MSAANRNLDTQQSDTELRPQTAGNEPGRDEIAQRAYERFEERGHVHGRDQDDWFDAERELRERGTRRPDESGASGPGERSIETDER
jgi:hypothetical protein